MKENKYIKEFKEDCKKLEEDLLMINPNKDLTEMATVSGKDTDFWFSVAIYSNDHNPKHMHIMSKNGEIVFLKIEITEKRPLKIEDLKCFDWNMPETNKIKKEIIKWAASSNKRGINYWDLALTTWEMLHPNN